MSSPAAAHILLFGDLGQAQAELLALAAQQKLELHDTHDPERALQLVCQQPLGMVFMASHLDVADFMKKLRQAKISTPVVVVGPPQASQAAVKFIRLGAIEYVPLPADPKILTSLLSKLPSPATPQRGPIAVDPRSQDLLTTAQKYAASQATVLIRGESGTGKEVFSRFIHDHSPRQAKAFISVNCAAIPENLLESELFGHEKGAFSGALGRRIGKFEQAHGGTLLLDEISEMDLNLQAKLLRAIQERVIDPIGAAKPISVDIRLIATTNRNLEEHIANGKFREDLYFRLNVVSLDLPALRDRPADIPPLAQHFADQYATQMGYTPQPLTPTALQKLTNCYWKGNVRELENTIHRAVILAGGVGITADHIVISPMSAQYQHQHPAAPQVRQQNIVSVQSTRASHIAQAYGAAANMYSPGSTIAAPAFIGRPLQEVEKELILSTLDYCGGNRTHAAEVLGISIQSLRSKLAAYEAEHQAG